MYLNGAKTQLMTSPPAGSVAQLSFFPCDSTTDTTDSTLDYITGSANTGNLFRWDSTANQYIYNLSTSNQKPGTYGVQITLLAGDGKTILAQSARQYFVLKLK